MKRCNFYSTTEEGQDLDGFITFDGTNLVSHPGPGNEEMFSEIMEGSVIIDDKKFYAKDGAEKWFNTLPIEYDGSYMRAEIVGRKMSPKRELSEDLGPPNDDDPEFKLEISSVPPLRGAAWRGVIPV